MKTIKKLFVLLDTTGNQLEIYSSKGRLHTRLTELFGNAVYSYSYFASILTSANSEIELEAVIKKEERRKLNVSQYRLLLRVENANYLDRSREATNFERIRLMIVDSHLLVSQAIELIFNRAYDITITASAQNGQTALSKLKNIPDEVDVVLARADMPEMDGIEFFHRIKEYNPSIKVILLTSTYKVDLIDEAIKLGVNGYLGQDMSADNLVNAIRRVYAGEVQYGQEVMDFYVANLATLRQKKQIAITPREREILQMMADGFSTGEISDRLYVATTTVETHRRNILAKFNVKNSAQLVSLAIRRGVIQ